MTYPVASFGFNEMMDCRGRVRELFAGDPASLGDAAELATAFFHREFVSEDGEPACALVRFFMTHPYGDLPEELQSVVRDAVPDADDTPDLRCLTLLATRGDEPEWNSISTSRGHRAIPLVSVEMVQQAPMIAQLITQMGVDIRSVVQPERTIVLDRANIKYNVFYVPRAAGSPHIVAQHEFVERYRIESVIGFGGLLTSGDLFAVIMFSKVPISPEVADQFRIIGLNLKIAFLPLVARKPLFVD